MVVTLTPQEGPQWTFHGTDSDVLFYGGAAGGGKSWSLLYDPLLFIDKDPKFGATIFRRLSRQITDEGALWDESMDLYPLFGGRPNVQKLRWTFPNGSRIGFAHLKDEKTKLEYHGSQIGYMGFDELQQISTSQFFYLLHRNRTRSSIPAQCRAGMNADADSWIAEFIQWWWDKETGLAIPERSGVVRYFIRFDNKTHWSDDRQSLVDEFAKHLPPQQAENLRPYSFSFIPSDVYDNPAMLTLNPGYLTRLLSLQPWERERLLDGNWKVRPGAGKFFNRGWFTIIPKAPVGGRLFRFWDFAATAADWRTTTKKPDPSYTASILLRELGGRWYIEDAINVRLGPGDVDELFFQVNNRDQQYARQTNATLTTKWELEPASASRREAYRLLVKLQATGQDASPVPPEGDKLMRARPFAIAAQAGLVDVVQGPWNNEYLSSLHQIQDSTHWDLMDASSGAYTAAFTVGEFKPF